MAGLIIHLLRRFGEVWGMSIHVVALSEVIAVATSGNAPDLVWRGWKVLLLKLLVVVRREESDQSVSVG